MRHRLPSLHISTGERRASISGVALIHAFGLSNTFPTHPSPGASRPKPRYWYDTPSSRHSSLNAVRHFINTDQGIYFPRVPSQVMSSALRQKAQRYASSKPPLLGTYPLFFVPATVAVQFIPFCGLLASNFFSYIVEVFTKHLLFLSSIRLCLLIVSRSLSSRQLADSYV